MNWLAHFYLSKPDPAFRIGNVLPDLLPIGELDAMPAKFQGGIACHRAIDAYTDAHPIFKRSLSRFSPRFRRFGGVLTDVFYDHYLVLDWDKYSEIAMPDFVAEVYGSFRDHQSELSPYANRCLEAMRTGDWISRYGEIEGIEYALKRMDMRLRKPFGLGEAIEELNSNYVEFHADFRGFFPELRSYVDSLETSD